MTKEEFQEVIDFAIKREEGAAELYRHAATLASSQDAREMFARFVNEEQRHKRLLEELEQGDVQAKSITPVQNLKISDYLVPMKFTPDMSYQDILILAMKREEQSHRLYTDMSSRVHDRQLKSLFEMLAGEEAKHKLKLETEYDESILREN